MSTSSVYDQRYLGDYRDHPVGVEIARCEAIGHFIAHVLKLGSVAKVLDYGAGSGMHVDLWEKTFPQAELHFCDISSVAMEKFKTKYPRHADRYYLVDENQSRGSDNIYDVIVSVEVMEHVEDLDFFLREISRLLKPGGHFIWTTPCANRLSIEHVLSAITGRIEQTNEGYRRWTWEDPTHLRRLRSKEAESLLRKNGFSDVRFRFSSHLFSFICTYVPVHREQHIFSFVNTYIPLSRARHFKNRLMTLDYSLFRCLPNAPSMIGGATKSILSWGT